MWVACTQFVTLLIALVISVLLATKPKGRKIFQILYFVPYICSSVAVSLMWRWFFNGETSGVLNTMLGTSIPLAARAQMDDMVHHCSDHVAGTRIRHRHV